MDYKKVFFLFLWVGCSALGMDDSKNQEIKPTINLKKITKQINNVNKLGMIKFGQFKLNLKKLLVEEPWVNKLACIKSVYKYMGGQEKIPSPKEVRTLFSGCLRYFNGKEKLMMKEVHDIAFVVAKNSNEGDWNYEISKKVALRSAQFLAQKELKWYDSRLVQGTLYFAGFASEVVIAICLGGFIRRPLERKCGKKQARAIMAGLAGLVGCGYLAWNVKLHADKSRLQNQVNGLKMERKSWESNFKQDFDMEGQGSSKEEEL